MTKLSKMSLVMGLSAMFLVSGCGYTTQTVLPRNIKKIYVETVKNKLNIEDVYAYQPGLEMDITNAVIRRFHQDGTLRVTEQSEADAILKTDLLRYEQEGLRFTNLENVKEYRLFVEVSLKLVDAKTGDVLWQESNFTGDNDYYVTNVLSLGEQKASEDVVERLAVNIVDRVVEDW